MRIELEGVSKAARAHALPETTLRFDSGEVTFAFAETEQRPTVLGLLASGRMKPDAGRVLIDGEDDPKALRRRVALVDAPDVSAPEPNVYVGAVVAEELMFAGRRSGPVAARRWLKKHDMDGVARRPFSNLAPRERLRLLCELAVLRRGVGGLVLVAPDRHGGDPRVWWRLAEGFAERGIAMLTVAGEASRLVLGIDPSPGAGSPPDDDARPPGDDAVSSVEEGAS